MIGRRTLLAVTTAALGAVAGAARLTTPALHRGRRRLTQEELDHALLEHTRWLEDRTRGRRADLAGCDLSGLDLGADEPGQVVLRNADFTEADLSHVRGNDVNFHHASFHRANLSYSHLKRPVFRCTMLYEANCSNATWGWPARDHEVRPEPISADEQAVFMSTFLSGSVFDHARVRGFFHDCSFTSSSLAMADFSLSQFAGDDATSNYFGRAKLIGTKFWYCRIDSARFDRATIENTDFLGSEIAPRMVNRLGALPVHNVLRSSALAGPPNLS